MFVALLHFATVHNTYCTDMESIDALAKAVNEFEGGMVLVSHDMRLISQVAKEIWICDNKTIEKYKGDIHNFKMDMRAQMGILGDQKGSGGLKGDASVVKKAGSEEPKPVPKERETKLEVVAPSPPKPKEASLPPQSPAPELVTEAPAPAPVPKPAPAAPAPDVDGKKKYIPPHLRRKMQQEQQT